MRKIYTLAVLLCCNFSYLQAQESTETFEDETVESITFTDNGQLFEIGAVSVNAFSVYNNSTPYGWNGSTADNRFLDNTSGIMDHPGMAISSNGGTGFVLKSMYVMAARADVTFTSLTGTCTISGYRNGTMVFTGDITAANLNKSFGTNNGYTLINLSTFGGANNSNTVIDRFSITATGNMQFLALDAITWAPASSPSATSTETFETEAPGSRTFTDNGQQFTVEDISRSVFDIYDSEGTASGWNGTSADSRYIDNTVNTKYTNPGFFVFTPDGAAFSLKRMFLYLSRANGDFTSLSGNCSITGYLNGSSVFNIVIPASNINQNESFRNGFTLIDFSTLGGVDNSNTTIDRFSVATTGNIQYVALDAMTWAPSAALPLRLLDFGVKQNTASVDINWKTDMEEPNTIFSVERSRDGRSFTTIAEIPGKLAAGVLVNQYSINDPQPFTGRNYYRLRMNENGKTTYSDIAHVLFGAENKTLVNVFPNPASDFLQIICDNEALWNKPALLLDMEGRPVRTITLKNRQQLDIRSIAPGMYVLRMPDNTVVKVTKF